MLRRLHDRRSGWPPTGVGSGGKRRRLQPFRQEVRRMSRRGFGMSKTPDELGRVLRRMYDDAPRGDKVASIHLFGIKYAADVHAVGANAADMVRASGLKASYVVEVNKGLNLAKFVVPKPQYAD